MDEYNKRFYQMRAIEMVSIISKAEVNTHVQSFASLSIR